MTLSLSRVVSLCLACVGCSEATALNLCVSRQDDGGENASESSDDSEVFATDPPTLTLTLCCFRNGVNMMEQSFGYPQQPQPFKHHQLIASYFLLKRRMN